MEECKTVMASSMSKEDAIIWEKNKQLNDIQNMMRQIKEMKMHSEDNEKLEELQLHKSRAMSALFDLYELI
ncbi:hypothetical protein [Staphylococcus gallinarum]|uniref:hypothetical protein n=1 Tax=Staphylococcus gallinarum TaxID=1293 RepID=UPI000E68E55C|nr:hypothetical protein [Staphylococcus gallinarum]RIL22345.1 hypothetical protein BUY97_10950 [Staphylococcus gallinarum]RIL23771.1 hypothetical protein BUY99_04200 [Staphylococcus gallinarum]